ncbi:hypothetical protein EDD17DRAFT_1507214 [Pisolithus thermaeus]|nr:hypothetical protein EV401DRAFT_1890912 [Pisolithus croceorrhizus]KAI6163502.1 hypothetical protein EDD17DRAFT_1507214 [Pisolithus thermaeus]
MMLTWSMPSFPCSHLLVFSSVSFWGSSIEVMTRTGQNWPAFDSKVPNWLASGSIFVRTEANVVVWCTKTFCKGKVSALAGSSMKPLYLRKTTSLASALVTIGTVQQWTKPYIYATAEDQNLMEQLSDFKVHMVNVDWKPLSSAIKTAQSEDLKIEGLNESGFHHIEDEVDYKTVDMIEHIPGGGCENLVISKETLGKEEVWW